MTAKSMSIRGAGCKFGGWAWKAVSLIAGDLLRVPKPGLRVEPFTLTVQRKSARVPFRLHARTEPGFPGVFIP